MRPVLLGLTTLLLSGMATPLWAADKPAATSTAAPDLASYTDAIARNPKFAKAYQSMVKLPEWAALPHATSTPTTPLSIGGKHYRVGNLCEPHNCGNNQLEVIFTEDGHKAWGLLSSTIGGKVYQMPLGDPDDTILHALNDAYKASNPQ
ncbi:Ivy family c-type lysozyme inhibitor [Acetobacter vaccinii]|nr:Ivy family c-type lysozyme inhibitor [Acetobacter vaccinii]